MQNFKLRTGVEVPEETYYSTIQVLKNLLNGGTRETIALYELKMRCKNSHHQFSDQSEEKLREFNLVQKDGNVHEFVQKIVLASIEGESMNMRLVQAILI